MPTQFQTSIVVNKQPMPISCDSDVLAVRAVLPLNVALGADDFAEMLVLPADHVPVDFMLDADRLDSDGSPTLTVTAGIMSGLPGLADTSRTVGAQICSAITTLGRSAGGTMVRTTLRPGVILPDKYVNRSIGIKFPAAAATFTADSTSLTMKGLWQPSTAYASGDAIYLPDGRRARCSTAGTSGSTFPFVGTEVKAGTVSDGGVTWTIVDAYIALTMWYRSSFGGY